MDDNALLIPVYLNQRIVFDLIAMLQGGISTVTTVTKIETSRDESAERVKASFGLSNALSTLLKIGLSGEKASSSAEDSSQHTSEERVHTPASLFYLLRSVLLEKGHAIKDGESLSIVPGNLLEFEASLRRNPIIETIDAMAGVMNMFQAFGKPEKAGNKQKHKHKKGIDENERIRKQMVTFTENLKVGDFIDLITEKLKSGHKAILTLEKKFLNDPTMSDLIDGKFKVLGKVIRCIDDDNESISLLRKADMSIMPPNILEQMFTTLSSLSETEGFNIPKLEWEITGPVIQVIPISIFA